MSIYSDNTMREKGEGAWATPIYSGADKSSSFPKLEVIWIKNCLDVTDVSMAKIASNCLKLRELDISNSIEISKKALKMVEGSCKNVKIIMEPPSNVRLSQEEARNFGLSN
ncbi:hypothetical protein YC2023_081470 [Brassica napus]